MKGTLFKIVRKLYFLKYQYQSKRQERVARVVVQDFIYVSIKHVVDYEVKLLKYGRIVICAQKCGNNTRHVC